VTTLHTDLPDGPAAATGLPLATADGPTPKTPTAPDLAAQLTGSVVTPADANWDEARQAWNLAVDQRPAMVVWPETVEDVVATVRHAAAAGLRVAPQGTGHGASALGDLTDAILLKTSRMRAVDIDPVARRARVAAGALWEDVTGPAGAHGLAALAGSAADVGVVGYSLGGGIGWLARRYGLASNSVVAAEVVTDGGEVLRVDADHHPDLFWALRGGGGSFGVVTALELELHPVAEVHAGMLLWPIERAREVLRAWRDWTERVPDSVTSVGRLLRFPPLAELPPFLSGRELVVVEATFLDGQEEADELLADLRALAPELDTFATVPAADLSQLHMDPPQPVPGIADHRLLGALPPHAIDALLDVAGAGVASPLLSVELRHLGGALAVGGPGHGALDRVEADYVMFAVGVPASPEVGAAVHAHLAAVGGALQPWDAGREYLNFAERPSSAWRVFGTALARLMTVRAMYDPHGRFQANHPVA
jgi:FAD/FMN-containing dehydrogenase